MKNQALKKKTLSKTAEKQGVIAVMIQTHLK